MKRNPKFWFENEKKLCELLGLQRQPGSGNNWIYKEDAKNEFILSQFKSTEASQITFKLEDLNKLFYHASVSHKTPLFINQFMNGPILLTMRLEDLEIIYKNLVLDERIKKENDSIINIVNDTKEKTKIASSKNRIAIKNKMKKQSDKLYSGGKNGKN
jgi:hypothetical protein